MPFNVIHYVISSILTVLFVTIKRDGIASYSEKFYPKKKYIYIYIKGMHLGEDR